MHGAKFIFEFFSSLKAIELVVLIIVMLFFIGMACVLVGLSVNKKSHPYNAIFSSFYLLILLSVPLILIVPLAIVLINPGVLLIGYAVFWGMQIVVTPEKFSSTTRRAAYVALGPWLWGLVYCAVSGSLFKGFLSMLLDEALFAGITVYTAFWITSPMIIFGPRTREVIKKPAMLILAVIVFLLFTALAIAMLLPAWQRYFMYLVLNEGDPHFLLVAVVSSLVQIAYEAYMIKKRLYPPLMS